MQTDAKNVGTTAGAVLVEVLAADDGVCAVVEEADVNAARVAVRVEVDRWSRTRS